LVLFESVSPEVRRAGVGTCASGHGDCADHRPAAQQRLRAGQKV